MSSYTSPGRIRRLIGVTALLIGIASVAGACGGSDEPAASATDSTDTADASGTASEAEGSGTATITIDDGTVYEFILSTCKTQDTDPSGFPISNGFDLFGKTADGEFGMQFIRAGFDDDTAKVTGSLEGDYDAEGKNELMLYSVTFGTDDLTASGKEVSGSFELRAVGPPTRPHGDDAMGTLEASC